MQNNTEKKLVLGITTLIVLMICLSITTFALIYSLIAVENNSFFAGKVKINLNDGKPVINELLIEPGMTFKKDFFIQNESSDEVYCRIYFENISGELSKIIDVEIKDGDELLYKGTPDSLSKGKTYLLNNALKLNERRELQIYFSFPENIGNEGQGLFLSFDLAVDAVQTRNNPDKNF